MTGDGQDGMHGIWKYYYGQAQRCCLHRTDQLILVHLVLSLSPGCTFFALGRSVAALLALLVVVDLSAGCHDNPI